jgi:hypothetical protein
MRVQATRPGDDAPMADRPRTARTEAAETGEAPAAAGAEAPPGPTARAGRARGDGADARDRAGPLPTRTPGASGPPPGGATPFAPAPSPGGGQPPPPTSPLPGRTSRRADRAAAGRGAPPQGATRFPGPPPVPDGPAPEPAPATLQSASVQTTKAGLPRRVPRANLAPGMVAARTAAAATSPAPASSSPSPASSAARSPEEVRSMLSSYRSGLERGRMMAAGDDADRGGDAHSSSRSDDDDATQ